MKRIENQIKNISCKDSLIEIILNVTLSLTLDPNPKYKVVPLPWQVYIYLHFVIVFWQGGMDTFDMAYVAFFLILSRIS